MERLISTLRAEIGSDTIVEWYADCESIVITQGDGFAPHVIEIALADVPWLGEALVNTSPGNGYFKDNALSVLANAWNEDERVLQLSMVHRSDFICRIDLHDGDIERLRSIVHKIQEVAKW